MRRARLGPAAALLAAASLAACTQTVAGTAAPAVPDVPVQASTSTVAVAAGSGGLDADALPNECLLNASEFGRLVGHAVRPPTQDTVPRGDGSSGSSCVVTAGASPIAMINVYRPRIGSAGEYVNVAQHPLAGLGDAAAVVTTEAGPMLQVAARGYLITILVSDGAPADEAWRTAATAALARLPG